MKYTSMRCNRSTLHHFGFCGGNQIKRQSIAENIEAFYKLINGTFGEISRSSLIVRRGVTIYQRSSIDQVIFFCENTC